MKTKKAGGGQRAKNATCVRSLHHRYDQNFQGGQGQPQEAKKAGGSQRAKNATCVKSLHHRHDDNFQGGQGQTQQGKSIRKT